MYLLYSFLLTLGFILLLPRFVFDALRKGKYITGLGERLGNLPEIPPSDQPVIWLHCVSVGETQAARPLVRALRERFSARIVISTTTVTGQRVARAAFGKEAAAIFYFPIDWSWTVRRALRTVRPSAVLIMETELWPNLLRECHSRSIPVALVNGRISDASFRRYRLVRPFFRRVLPDLSAAMMQSEPDAARIRELGLAADRLTVPGNLKFDSSEIAVEKDITAEFRQRFGLARNDSFIIAASTHAPEERVVLEAFKRARSSHPAVRLLIAPRHPERFADVANLLQRSSLAWSQRSSPASTQDESADAILLDTIGELRALYPLADVVFVGGSIAPHGGHNMLEPAAAGACVVTGPHTENFAAITKALLAEQALVQLPKGEESQYAEKLASALVDLLANSEKRLDIGQRALEVCRQNRGATARTIELLSGIFAGTEIVKDSIPFSALQVSTVK